MEGTNAGRRRQRWDGFHRPFRWTWLSIALLMAGGFAWLAWTAGDRLEADFRSLVRNMAPPEPPAGETTDFRHGVRFEPNVGQSAAGTDYVARGPGYQVLLDAGVARIILGGIAPVTSASLADSSDDPGSQSAPPERVQMRLVGADPESIATAEGRRRGVSHYLGGSNPAGWYRNVPHFDRVRYAEAWPGIDVIYRGGSEGRLEYDFAVSPHADPGQIRLAFSGQARLHLDDDGTLVLATATGSLRQPRPTVHQDIDGEKRSWEAHYQLMGAGEVAIDVGDYDPGHPLLIDPAIDYASYLGGPGDELAYAVAVDARGRTVVAGAAWAPGLPVTDALQPEHAGRSDLFVARLAADGSEPEFVTYLGGSGTDIPFDIAVDAADRIHVVGATGSAGDFPLADPLQPLHGGGALDAFALALQPDGSALDYSTYLGGSGSFDIATAVALGGDGTIHIGGITSSTDLPLRNAFQPRPASEYPYDGFIVRLPPSGRELFHSTYIGGTSFDDLNDIAVDADGNTVVTGTTSSADFPLSAPLQPAFGGVADVFVSIVEPGADGLIFSTLLGGVADDGGRSVAIDGAGYIVVGGHTHSPDFPVRRALQPSLDGNRDGFVVRLLPAGLGIDFATYLGGSGIDLVRGVAADAAGDIHVIGETKSPDLPLADPFQAAHAGGEDGLYARLSADGSVLRDASYLGGSADDVPRALALGPTGQVHIVGTTRSTDFPVSVDAIQRPAGGGADAFVVRVRPTGTANVPPRITSEPVTTARIGEPYNYDAIATDDDGDPLTWALPAAPAGMQIDARSGRVTWTPEQAARFDVTVAVDDGRGGSDSQSFAIEVRAGNADPVITSVPATSAVPGREYVYEADATDADGDELTWSLTVSPPGMEIDPETGTVIWTPDSNSLPATVTVRVSDGRGGSATQRFTITGNEPPAIDAIPDASVDIDAPFRYDVTATDPEGDPVTFALTDAPAGMRIDAETGALSWTPRTAGASSVTVQAADPHGAAAQRSFTITVSYVPGKRPPVLDALPGIIEAPLGRTTRLLLSGSDPDDDEITFGARPLPLPEGMMLNAKSGELEFRPGLDQVGDQVLTFTVTDGRFSDARDVTIRVPEPPGVTSLTGRVVAFDDIGLPGVRLVIGDLKTRTDDNGDFRFDALPAGGRVRLLIDGATATAFGTYATVPEMIELIPGADNHLEPDIVLLPLDTDSADLVIHGERSVVTSSPVEKDGVTYEPVTMTVPANRAVWSDTGEPFGNLVHISAIPDNSLTPRPLPPELDPAIYIAIQPFGVVYTEPVPISFPNVEGFAPGGILDVFALDHDSGRMIKIGEVRVSSDGRTLDSIGGIVVANSWHAVVPQSPETDKTDDEDKEGDDGDCPCGSTFGLASGRLEETHTTPAYRSLGASRAVTLLYDSTAAEPSPILHVETTIGNFSPPPDTMSITLEVGGIAQGIERYALPGTEPSDIRGQFESTRPAVQFDASGIDTGLYAYSLGLHCWFPKSRRSEIIEGEVIVRNASASPVGAGWTLRDLSRLHESGTGAVLLSEGHGEGTIFRPDGQGGYDSPASDFSVLEREADGTWTRSLPDGTRYRFDARGRQTSMTDRNGNVTRYAWNAQDQLTAITDPAGLVTELSYFAGLLRSITDPAGRTTRLAHDAAGNLVRIIEPDGAARSFEYEPDSHRLIAQTDHDGNRNKYSYDAFGRVREITHADGTTASTVPADTLGLIDPETFEATPEKPAPMPPLVDEVRTVSFDANGHVSLYELDERGAITRRTDAVGRTTEIDRDADSLATRTTRPNGTVVTRTFDDAGRILTETEEYNGATTRYEYDRFGRVTRYIDPLGRVTITDRDARGNPTAITNALGHVTRYTYDNRGLPLTRTDPNGVVTTWTYNAAGLVATLTETPPDGSDPRVTTLDHDEAGNLVRRTRPDGIRLEYGYDRRGRLETITDNVGNTVRLTRDGRGNIVRTDTEDPDGTLVRTLRSVYDSQNRLVETRAPHAGNGESITRRVFDGEGNLTSLTDPNGHTTSHAYDAVDRLLRTIDPLEGVTEYRYDDNDRLTGVIAPNGATTTYGYDPLGRQRSETSPDRGTLTYEVDLAGNVTAVTDARGVTTTYRHDALNRVTAVDYPGEEEDITYTWDQCQHGPGRLCQVTDAAGSTAYGYDPRGNVTATHRTEAGSETPTRYTYDAADRLTAMTLPSGRQVTYERDALGRVSAVRTTVMGAPVNLLTDIGYRADGLLTEATWANGMEEPRAYDRQGRLTHQALTNQIGQTVDERTYRYDPDGNLLERDTTPQRSTYAYDALDRLIEDAIGSDDPIRYTYGPNHNRLEKTAGTLRSAVSSYREGSNRLLVTETVSLGDEQLEPDLSQRFTYNRAGRLSEVIEDGETVATYTYNHLSQRTRKVLKNGETTVFHYDLNGNVIAETDRLGNVTREYLWLDSRPIAQIDVNGPIETLTQIHTDHLLTPRLATDERGTVTWRWEGEAFGSSEPDEDPDGDGLSTEINLRFPGQYADKESDLVQNWLRTYDQGSARYLRVDPLGLNGGSNSYAYVSHNPLRYVDPQGALRWEGTISGFALGVFGRFTFDLTSECVNDERAKITVRFIGGGLGIGAKIAASSSAISLQEPLQFIQPEIVFNGGVFIGSASAAIPPTPQVSAGVSIAAGKPPSSNGYGCAAVQLGVAGSIGCSRIRGFDVSVGALWGRSQVVSSATEDCCEP